jgi:hypothetical protein
MPICHPRNLSAAPENLWVTKYGLDLRPRSSTSESSAQHCLAVVIPVACALSVTFSKMVFKVLKVDRISSG